MSDFRPVVIIPSRNHGLTLGCVLEGLAPLKLPVIVVDDASDAESARELDRLAALHPEMTLLRHEVNRGKGGAFLTGLEHAASEGYTHALQVDSDGQHDLADAPRSSSPPAGIPASSGRRVPNTTSPFRRSA